MNICNKSLARTLDTLALAQGCDYQSTQNKAIVNYLTTPNKVLSTSTVRYISEYNPIAAQALAKAANVSGYCEKGTITSLINTIKTGKLLKVEDVSTDLIDQLKHCINK